MKKHTKKTLHGYLLEYRIHMAKNYLTTTSLNVTEIAEKTGFASYTYFIKTFREQTGLSPLKYRKTHENIGF
jgi:transcriptional regulator GlxA family with amidase domain